METIISTLQGYTLTERIRQRSQFAIYRGWRDADHIPVVVKATMGESVGLELLARLRHEHALLETLDRNRVVRTLGLIQAANGLALVLEDLGDNSLASQTQSRLQLREFLRFAIEISQILESIHARNVIHKDIKPQHFLNTHNGLKLIDFGLATRLSREAQAATPENRFEGTLAYISPEQTGRMNSTVDLRADLYSAGIVLYELLTGCLPFQVSDPLELLHCHIARVPRPPHEVSANVPEILSKIILKLLAKAPEDRYQGASGLVADLETCRQRFERSGRIDAFSLGAEDVTSDLRIPRKLYGREPELQNLYTKLAQTRKGTAELVLITGPSGIGKSALVHELAKEVAVGGLFTTGKFDPLTRSTPYSAIVNVCRQLILWVLAEPQDKLVAWQDKLSKALGRNARIMVELVPELEQLIGPQPEVPVLPPTESQLRFELAFQEFFLHFASSEHPLVLFLDDLQWADSASLRLLQLILVHPRRGHLLVLGAYRESEVIGTHALSLALQQLSKTDAVVSEIRLGPLALQSVTRMLGAAMRLSDDTVLPLAELTLRKTLGNPFFVTAFLETLVDKRLVYFDLDSRRWCWELSACEAVLATDNVVDLVIERLQRLSLETARVLRLAACVGYRFDLSTLRLIAQPSTDDIPRALWEALSEGLILPVDSTYRYISDASHESTQETQPNASYCFLHDRVRQAVYDQLDPSDRKRVHLRTGQHLLERTNDTLDNARLFEIVNHLNIGEPLIESLEQRHSLARLNLNAASRAAAAGAYATGSGLLMTCLALLGQDAFAIDYDTAKRAHLLLAECSFLNGEQEPALELLDRLEAHSKSTPEKATARTLRVTLLSSMNRQQEALAAGLEMAALLGAPMSVDDAELKAAIGAELGALETSLAQRPIEALLELPEMTDPEKLALLELLFKTNPVTFQTVPALTMLFGVKAVNLALAYGNGPTSAYFYANFGIINWIIGGDLDRTYRFGRLCMELSKKRYVPAMEGPIHFVFGGFNSHWKVPLSQSAEYLHRGIRASLEAGDHAHAGWCAVYLLYLRIHRGGPLDEDDPVLLEACEVLKQTELKPALQLQKSIEQTIKCLRGLTRSPDSFDDDAFDENAFVESFQGNAGHRVSYNTLKAITLYLAGEYRSALAYADAAQPMLPAQFVTKDHLFYRALISAALISDSAAEERETLIEDLRKAQGTLAVWTAASPVNHAHQHALLGAELARVTGLSDQALDLYDRAMTLARDNGFLAHEAIATELCARFHLAFGRKRLWRDCLESAWRKYRIWGAVTKLKQLSESCPELDHEQQLEAPMSFAQLSVTTSLALSASHTRSKSVAGFDLISAIRATQAIAGELLLDRLLTRLMRTLIENAGAQTGVLLLERGGTFEIEACSAIDSDTVQLRVRESIAISERVATSVVQYVLRSQKEVVLGDACREPRFARDPYIARVQPRSLLCIPMLNQGRLIGALYLENNLVNDAFNPARVQLLQFLAAQAAQAVANARLYGELTQVTEKLRRNNETLELQVQDRTRELQQTLNELWCEMDLARKIQTVLLPRETQLEGYELSATMLPATQVGGDYYDVISANDCGWLLVGDVTGHGVAAGLTMMMIQTAVRSIILAEQRQRRTLTPARLLSLTNAAVRNSMQKISDKQYMTIVALQAQGNRVCYSGLHLDILVYRAGMRTAQRVQTNGMCLGLFDDISEQLTDEYFELSTGDIVLLYTDGITETKVAGQMLGTEGLVRIFTELATRNLDASEIVQGILSTLEGAADDDITLLVARYMG